MINNASPVSSPSLATISCLSKCSPCRANAGLSMLMDCLCTVCALLRGTWEREAANHSSQDPFPTVSTSARDWCRRGPTLGKQRPTAIHPYLQNSEQHPVCMLPAVTTAENCLVSSAQEEKSRFWVVVSRMESNCYCDLLASLCLGSCTLP
jgi:hypothetical protein